MKTVIRGAVQNPRGEQYQGLYSIRGNDMVFGTHSIDVQDFIEMAMRVLPDGI
jgi:hypothetical protein